MQASCYLRNRLQPRLLTSQESAVMQDVTDTVGSCWHQVAIHEIPAASTLVVVP